MDTLQRRKQTLKNIKNMFNVLKKIVIKIIPHRRFLQVYIDLNNKCNLRCIMCHFSRDLREIPVITMNLALFKKVAREVFPRTLSASLSCSCEPLLVPNFSDYLDIVKKSSIPNTRILTNALLLRESIIESIIDANITNLDISMDGATKETYEKIRIGGNFDYVISNIHLFQEIKRKRGKIKPALSLFITLMKTNISELPGFLRLAKRLNANYVRATHLIPFKSLNIMEESLANCRDKTNAIFDECREIAKKLNLSIDIPPNFDLSAAEKSETAFNRASCLVPFESTYIISDGKVIPCSWFSLKEWCAGDISKDNFMTIWNGKVYKKLRSKFKNKEYTEYCKNCPVWGSSNIKDYVFTERIRKDVLNISSSAI